jgi:hypothetical protein
MPEPYPNREAAVTERALGSDRFGVGVVAPHHDLGRNERGILVVRKYDQEMAAYVAAKLGIPGPGQAGFRTLHDRDFARFQVKPYEVRESTESNLLTTAGWDRILTLAIAGGGQAWDATHTRIGVGTATAAAASGDTTLGATGTSAVWSRVTGAGTVGTGTAVRRLSFVSTFGTGDANMVWAEWGIDQSTAAGVTTGAATAPFLNHAISAQGTKASGQTWTATATLDFT